MSENSGVVYSNPFQLPVRIQIEKLPDDAFIIFLNLWTSETAEEEFISSRTKITVFLGCHCPKKNVIFNKKFQVMHFSDFISSLITLELMILRPYLLVHIKSFRFLKTFLTAGWNKRYIVFWSYSITWLTWWLDNKFDNIYNSKIYFFSNK